MATPTSPTASRGQRVNGDIETATGAPPPQQPPQSPYDMYRSSGFGRMASPSAPTPAGALGGKPGDPAYQDAKAAAAIGVNTFENTFRDVGSGLRSAFRQMKRSGEWDPALAQAYTGYRGMKGEISGYQTGMRDWNDATGAYLAAEQSAGRDPYARMNSFMPMRDAMNQTTGGGGSRDYADPNATAEQDQLGAAMRRNTSAVQYTA